MLGRLVTPSLRPYLLLAAIVIVLAVVDAGQGRFINRATAFSVLQQFATIGPVALALGLSMIVREFDLSVGGMLSLAGCLAVMSGGTSRRWASRWRCWRQAPPVSCRAASWSDLG